MNPRWANSFSETINIQDVEFYNRSQHTRFASYANIPLVFGMCADSPWPSRSVNTLCIEISCTGPYCVQCLLQARSASGAFVFYFVKINMLVFLNYLVHGYLAFGYIYKHLNRSLRKHSDLIVWEHQRRRPACTTAPSDKCFCYSPIVKYSKTCLKRPIKNRQNEDLKDKWQPNEGQKYCRMLQENILQYFYPALSDNRS